MTAPSSARARVLLTGCTGFVGKVVLEELLRRKDELGIDGVYLLIRPRRNKTPAERFDLNVAPSPCFSRLEPGWRALCHPIAGDITEDRLGLSEPDAARLQGELTHIIHCAASVKFDLPIAEATRINITGALDVLAFAQRCSNLERLVDVSTAYVTPHRGDGVPIEEELVDLPFDAEEVYAAILAGEADEQALLAQSRHANTYTFTKCLAEVLLAKRRGNTPLTLLRPSIVSACRRYPFPGWIDSRAAYAAVVSLLGAGHLRVVRMDPNVLLDVVPCDDVAGRILSCAFDPSLQEPLVIRHAVAGLANSGRAARLTRTHERFFKAHPHERQARWAYAGPSKALFRLNEWMHHHVPLGAARVAARLQRRKKDTVKIEKLAAVLGYLDGAFHYFGHHTFDFRTAFPPLEDFDLDSYLDSISQGVSQHLLKRDPKLAPLRMHGTDLGWALRQPDGNATVRAFAYFMRKVLRAAGAEITFNETELKAALREVGDEDLVVLAPSHRSYMDFLVTSLLCFAHPGLGLRIPQVAATDDFARIPIVGSVLKAAGAFYIRRGLGGPDPALTRQITELVRAGHSLEFYAEGKRSRSRRFLAPKRGILRALQSAGRPAVVLPLAISYDRIAEEEGFVGELEGQGRHKGGLRPLAAWIAKLMRSNVQLGRIHIRCGAPLRLEADTDVVELSRALVAELQRHTTVTTYHLKVFCERNAELGIEPAALRRAIVSRGGTVIESRLRCDGEVPEPIQRTFEGQWMHLFYDDARRQMRGNAAVASHIRRNGFWFPRTPPSGDPLTAAVVQALFEPICRDYERVTRALETFPPDTEITAHEMLRRVPGAFLRDVEDVLDDLAGRNVLVRDRDVFRWANGARDLSRYRDECAWQPEMLYAKTAP